MTKSEQEAALRRRLRDAWLHVAKEIDATPEWCQPFGLCQAINDTPRVHNAWERVQMRYEIRKQIGANIKSMVKVKWPDANNFALWLDERGNWNARLLFCMLMAEAHADLFIQEREEAARLAKRLKKLGDQRRRSVR